MRPPTAFAATPPPSLSKAPWDAAPLVSRTALSALSLKAWPQIAHPSPHHVASASAAPTLGPMQLTSSLSTILLAASLLRLVGLNAQSLRILSAAGRMSLQLSVMGVFVLTPLFAYAGASPWRIAGWIGIVAILASKEAKSRSTYSYRGQMRDCLAAIGGGVGITLLHLVTCILRPPRSSAKPNISAQTIVPIAGMLFGNALSAATLGMSVLLSNFLEGGRDAVELRLAHGANVWEASLPAVREAAERALLPTVNAMAATGLIFMPGMMTGQILGGQSPSAAAAYQIMIYFAIAASSCLTAMLLSGLVAARMFDGGSGALVPRRSIPGLKEKKAERAPETLERGPSTDSRQLPVKFRVLDKRESLDVSSEPLLRVRQLTVQSTNLTVPSLDIYAGDRIGVRGRSGAGKTQLLRSLARLDPVMPVTHQTDANGVTLGGQTWTDMPPARWRSEVMWVSQDRPTLSGTPREFYSQVSSYRIRWHSDKCNGTPTPMDIAREWNLNDNAWDRPWSDISGGEAQRVSLAIALSLRPAVLLLDEPTSSCDADATSRMERTLLESNATFLMVSHSEDQLERLCTGIVELSR